LKFARKNKSQILNFKSQISNLKSSLFPVAGLYWLYHWKDGEAYNTAMGEGQGIETGGMQKAKIANQPERERDSDLFLLSPITFFIA
jgi:hypothetical protein